MKTLTILLALVTSLSAEIPEVFQGYFQEDVPVRASIGMVQPPAEIEKYIAKVEAGARKNPEWFKEFTAEAKPGIPLPFHENLGLTKEEYDEYLAIWEKREFKSQFEVMLVLRKSTGNTWTITASGEAGAISTLRYDPENGSFQSPNGTLARIEDIDAPKETILGAWKGKEWRFEESTSLGKTKENFAIGKFTASAFGLLVYRAQEVSTEGTRLFDKSLVIRFPLGKAGQVQPPK
jgi:hypothetical protein